MISLLRPLKGGGSSPVFINRLGMRRILKTIGFGPTELRQMTLKKGATRGTIERQGGPLSPHKHCETGPSSLRL